MELFVLYLGFIGAWVLFAGSIYQAALDLKDEDIAIDRLRAARQEVRPPRHASAWWWLLPPVKAVLESRSRNAYKRDYLMKLSHEDVEGFVNFQSKVSAWYYVAFGGFCLACKETYELVVYQSWNVWAGIGLVVLAFLLSIAHLVSSVRRADAITKLR